MESDSGSGITYFAVGQGMPILFVHGWQLDHKCEAFDYEPIFNSIPGFRRFYVDLPGMGSSPTNGIRNLDDVYHRLVQFIDVQIAGSQFLLAGSSCGAYLARALARKYASQVDGLLLRVPLVEPETNKRDIDVLPPVVRDEAYLASLTAKLDAVVVPAVKNSDDKALQQIRKDPQKYRLSVDLEDPDRKFPAPTLILCGRHDTVVGYRDSLRLLDAYSRSTFVVLDRGTHELPLDERGVFDSMVRDWVYRVNEYRSVGREQ